MNLNFLNKDKTEKLLQKSANIISIFEQTQFELENVNKEINVVITDKRVKISEIQNDINTLTATVTKNISIHTKINQFLNT